MRELFESWTRSKGCYVYLVVATPVVILLAKMIGSKLFLPVAMTFVLYPVYALDLTQGRRDLAAVHTFLWAFVASVVMIGLTRYDDAEMAKIILHGTAYRDEMFQWILTGEGSEGDLSLFLPEHLRHFTLFCAASFFTAGVWGLILGSILLNYMNFYVGSLSLKAHHPLVIFLFGWPTWSHFRVAGFVLCGIALSEPLLSQLFRFRLNLKKCTRFFVIGLLFILADILLKANLASFWRNLLRGVVSL